MGYHRQSLPRFGNFEIFETLEPRRMMARVMGIDVSDVQGTIDWAQVAASGKQFAFIHASSGGTTGDYDPTTGTGTFSERYDDADVDANVAGAQAAGLEVGVYHVARADIQTNTGTDEAQHFLDVAGAYIGNGYLPPVLELTTGSALSRAALTTWVTDFSDTIFTAAGVAPIIYVDSTYANRELSASLGTSTTLWLTRPTTTADPATGNPTSTGPALPNVYGIWNPDYPQIPNPQPWTFWQYNITTGHVSGVAGVVNLDVFNGDIHQLREGFVQGYVPPSDPNLAIQVTFGSTVVSDGDTEDFGTAVQGATPPTMTFTIKNISDEPVLLSDLAMQEGNLSPFSITDGLVPYLMPGETDTFVVQLRTGSAGVDLSDALQFDLDGPVTTTFIINFQGEVDSLTPTFGAIYGTLFEDVNGDGIREAGENGLSGWDVWADLDNNGIQDPTDPSTTTSTSGLYSFNDIATIATGHLVTIHYASQTGWYQTAPGAGTDISINVFPNISTHARDLGVAHVAQLSGYLFIDVDHNGIYDSTIDTPLRHWLVYIDRNHNGVLDPFEDTARSDGTGLYQFTDLQTAPNVILRAIPRHGYGATNTSSYNLNIFSNDDIQEEDFGFRILQAPVTV